MRKAIFYFPKIEGGKHVTWSIFKWDEKTTQLLKIIIFYFHRTISAPYASKITHPQVIPATQATRITPLDLVEEAPFIRYQQVLSSRSSYLWPNIFHQVVLNRGHGFSKRFIPAGVYNSTHTNQPLAPPGLQDREVPTKKIDSRPLTRRTLSMRQPKTGTPRQQGVGHLLAAPVSLSEIQIRVRPSLNPGRP